MYSIRFENWTGSATCPADFIIIIHIIIIIRCVLGWCWCQSWRQRLPSGVATILFLLAQCPSAYVENAPIIEANFTRFSLVLLMKQYHLVISIVFHFRWLMITYAMALMATMAVFVEWGNIVSSAIEFNLLGFFFSFVPVVSSRRRRHFGPSVMGWYTGIQPASMLACPLEPINSIIIIKFTLTEYRLIDAMTEFDLSCGGVRAMGLCEVPNHS